MANPPNAAPLPVSHPDSPHTWSDYYDLMAGRPPRETLLRSLSLFDAEAKEARVERFVGYAVDLGCGEGRDTVELVRRGWRVLAMDGEPEAIARLQSRPDLQAALAELRLETHVQRFEQLILPADLDLINASFCLPFCPPDQFPALWQTLTHALRPGGRMCGQLFGDRDSWAAYDHMTHLTRPQAEALLQSFTIEQFEEEAHPGTTALGEAKFWHIFHWVIRK
ncbi:class I SAM-dependent methyltransferase [Thermoleptolyngbya sichuanensis XZ-Cy5]|uniref:class I SAM-dependent methyltransferase n=1 Tax=Thermoleptolyngbya sichuanensis TaxID=2885951 RepID=UPI00240DC93F|nr:class I SAM-dependent methyltransferase [Thermoleptolyngbya sichuanensis]MDG2614897.1 class I SAM-dependent methyltransferase [Thermoleptolyngbya sichuanensis XZ-Cy5]